MTNVEQQSGQSAEVGSWEPLTVFVERGRVGERCPRYSLGAGLLTNQ